MVRGLATSLRHTFSALRVREDLRALEGLTRRLLRLEERVPRVSGPGQPAPEVDALLRQDDRQLDVALAATLLAWEDLPEAVDPAVVLDEFDELAHALRQRLRAAGPDPQVQLATLNHVFFDELGFTAPSELSQGPERLADLLFPFVLRRRRGHCVGLSTVYLALGYRVGLPVFGVSAPGHFFVRWDGAGLRRNVETTARGLAHDDAWYVERFGIATPLVDRGVYLQSLRRREVLVEVLNNRANVWWDGGDAARASRDLDRVVHVSHNFPRAYLGRGFMALQHGDLGAARRELERAIAIDPDFPRAHLLLGEVHLRAGRVDAAEAAFQRAMREASHALACTNLGRVHARRGQLEQAQVWHERALSADPSCHVAWNNLGVVYRAAGEQRRARGAFRKAVALAPQFLPARENLLFLGREGQARLGLRERASFRAVCRSYEARLRRAPEDDPLRAAYVRFLLEAGQDQERALQLARAAVRRRPSARNYETLVHTLRRSGDTPAALAALEEGLQAAPGTDSERLLRLAERLRGGGEPGGRPPGGDSDPLG